MSDQRIRWRMFWSTAIHKAQIGDCDQTRWMPRLIRIFGGSSGSYYLRHHFLMFLIVQCFACVMQLVEYKRRGMRIDEEYHIKTLMPLDMLLSFLS